ncbi:MAG: hypothetical protein ACRD37_10595, partial [Candidatus Acidiferrales bacterium]
MRFVDFEFVKRLEMAIAVSGQACGESMLKRHPEFPSAIEKIAGGIAVFTGADSPITQAIGVGLDGPVSEEDLDRLGEFFRTRGAPAALEMCPFIDAALIESLGKRGYVVAECSNVLFRESADVTKFNSAAEGVVVRPAKLEESKLYTETISKGYAEDLAISQ